MSNAVAERLRIYRAMRGYTQAELAQHANVSATVIAHAEQGREVPSARTLRLIADALGLSGNDTIDLLVMAAQHKEVVDIDGLGEKQLRAIIARVERYRREDGRFGACAKCNAGPMSDCAGKCETRTQKRGGGHG